MVKGMARCDYPGCDWTGKKAGLPIHKARAHDIHPNHDLEVGVKCPVPWCTVEVKDLEAHLEAEHEDWRRSDGRWVFEHQDSYTRGTDSKVQPRTA
jgi:hypothetical protein